MTSGVRILTLSRNAAVSQTSRSTFKPRTTLIFPALSSPAKLLRRQIVEAIQRAFMIVQRVCTQGKSGPGLGFAANPLCPPNWSERTAASRHFLDSA